MLTTNYLPPPCSWAAFWPPHHLWRTSRSATLGLARTASTSSQPRGIHCRSFGTGAERMCWDNSDNATKCWSATTPIDGSKRLCRSTASTRSTASEGTCASEGTSSNPGKHCASTASAYHCEMSQRFASRGFAAHMRHALGARAISESSASPSSPNAPLAEANAALGGADG